MALRCMLFACDEGAAQPVRQVLADLRIEAEHCPDAVAATERVTSQLFNIVIIDWDDQPDAAFLLNAARTRKAAERPIALAIVSNDADVSKALQAGANSILRKPILASQVRDTISTARDLLRAKSEATPASAVAPAAKAPAMSPTAEFQGGTTRLRAGEFLPLSSSKPSAQFITESDMPEPVQDPGQLPEVEAVADLEPMAATLEKAEEALAEPAPAPSEPRGLAWYLRARTMPTGPAPEPAPPANTNQLLGYDQMPSSSRAFTTKSGLGAPAQENSFSNATLPPLPPQAGAQSDHEQEATSQLFAYLDGEKPEPSPRAGPGLSFYFERVKLVAVCLVVAAVLGAVFYLKTPRNPWKPKLERLADSGVSAGHKWLNPQPVIPKQVPTAHETFAGAGDEYKLPAADNIPDATTDPSQINVVPVIDPTAKKPNGDNSNGASQVSNPDAAAAPAVTNQSANQDATASQSAQQPSAIPAIASTPVSATPAIPATPGVQSNPVAVSPSPGSPAPVQQPASIPIAANAPPVTRPISQLSAPPHYTPATVGIPSSLKSQLASSTPDASGNKSPDTALPSIEPVALAEASARALLVQQPAPAYPDSAKGLSGTVVLQVFVGRDGSVQDAKFLQGSLVFARAAIDAVKQWRFQPYAMNGRPVSTVTSLTLSFKPSQ